METKAFFDPNTFTLTYVVSDPATKDAVIIDPVLDFDPLTWRTSTSSIQKVRECTPACMSFKIGDAVYDSVAGKLYKLADSTKAYVGHDYQPNGRELAFETTIGESKEKNIRLSAGTSKSDFVAARQERDSQLSPPKLILQSLQVNIEAGRLPSPESNDRRYLKMPINFLGSWAFLALLLL